MNIPAIKANIGTWKYYITTLSFSDVAKLVKKVDKEIHNSDVLSEMLQRSITNNYQSIRSYILSQDERFFNSLVLAIYDGDPQWVEVNIAFEGNDYFNVGFLTLNGNEKIFPIDGQHRVQGIKAALKENSQLANECIPVIFVGHKNSNEGKQRSRRLFSTLNRYAKPVSPRDKIALDEDDIAAIVTRNLVENFDLFKGERIINVAGKAIPDTNKTAFTSIVTLYQCNIELLKCFLSYKGIKKSINEYIRFRPNEDIIQEFDEFCFSFWNSFKNKLEVVSMYLSSKSKTPADKYRHKETGGNLLFRPIGLLPFVLAAFELKKRKNTDFDDVLGLLNNVNLNINKIPWKQVLWNDYDKTMLRGDNPLVKLLLMYQVDKGILTKSEIDKLKMSYAAKLGFPIESIDEVLDSLG